MSNVALFLEMKNEYTEHLVGTLTPYICEGLMSFYNEALIIAEENKSIEKTGMIFQKLLQNIDSWPQHKIEEETNRIKQMSGTSDCLDDLVKCVVKSNIILLTYSNNVSNVIAQTFYNSLSTSALIHRCYLECAKDIHNNPFLFHHDVTPMESKRNQIIIKQNVEQAIVKGVRKILPIGLILKEYLANSVNIIYEPPNVELIGENTRINNQYNALVDNKTLPVINGGGVIPHVSEQKIKSEIKPDKQLDKYVMNMVKNEYEKSDRDKVKALIQLEKVVNSENNRHLGGNGSRSPENKKHGDNALPYMQKDKTRSNDYTPNKKLNKSDRAVININFDSDSESEKTSARATTLSEKHRVKHRRQPEMSEVIDPNNNVFIEEYGGPTDTKKKHNRY